MNPLPPAARAGIVPEHPGPTPNGFTDERWRKLCENARRAEKHTGVAPIAADGWETVAVILMDRLDAVSQANERLEAMIRFLELHDVQVRTPLVYGSRELFWAYTTGDEEEETQPSNLREQIESNISEGGQ